MYSGSPFTTPVITATTLFYAQDRFTTNYPIAYAGPVNNSFGGGGYSTNAPDVRYLIFDAVQTIQLHSVWVFAQVAGNRTIELRDASNNVLQTKIVTLPMCFEGD